MPSTPSFRGYTRRHSVDLARTIVRDDFEDLKGMLQDESVVVAFPIDPSKLPSPSRLQ
jgi:hypothetical protein